MGERGAVLGQILECARTRASTPELHRLILEGLRKVSGWDSAIFVPDSSRNVRPTHVNKDRFFHLVPRILQEQRFGEDKERGRSAGQKQGGLYLDTEVYSADERLNLPFFAEIMRPQGITSRICISLEFAGIVNATVHLCRHTRVDNFSSQDVAKLRPLVAGIAVADAARMHGPTLRSPIAEAVLTPREREVVEYAARGLRTRDIALCLGTSPNTVNHQLQKIFDKLGISTRSELVAWALGPRS